jgi:hypothetical protein
MENGHITPSSLSRECKQKDVLTIYKLTKELMKFFPPKLIFCMFILSFCLLFNKRERSPASLASKVIISFFHVSDLATRDRERLEALHVSPGRFRPEACIGNRNTRTGIE